MRLKISEIHKIKNSPQGYIDEFIENGIISQDGLWLDLSDENFNKLRDKYGHIHDTHKLILSSKINEHFSRDLKPTTTKEMFSSLTSSLVDWTKSGFQLTENNLLKIRLDICRGCDLWDPNGFGGTGRCSSCGCSTQAKLRMATEKCPIGKW